MHLAIDGYGADYTKLSDEVLVFRFLNDYPDVIGMTKVAPPQVYSYTGKVPDDWGVSGFVIIAESHISVHTFPDRGYVNIDVFSCKNFDAAESVSQIEQVFGLTDVRVSTLERGLEHSTPREAYGGMVRERVSLGAGPSAGDD